MISIKQQQQNHAYRQASQTSNSKLIDKYECANFFSHRSHKIC